MLVAEVIVERAGHAARACARRGWWRSTSTPQIARYEADEEVQDLLNASPGLNLGIDFLPGAFGYEGEAATPADDGRAGALARRLHRQRRPHLAQPQPAAAGTTTSG